MIRKIKGEERTGFQVLSGNNQLSTNPLKRSRRLLRFRLLIQVVLGWVGPWEGKSKLEEEINNIDPSSSPIYTRKELEGPAAAALTLTMT